MEGSGGAVPLGGGTAAAPRAPACTTCSAPDGPSSTQHTISFAISNMFSNLAHVIRPTLVSNTAHVLTGTELTMVMSVFDEIKKKEHVNT